MCVDAHHGLKSENKLQGITTLFVLALSCMGGDYFCESSSIILV